MNINIAVKIDEICRIPIEYVIKADYSLDCSFTKPLTQKQIDVCNYGDIKLSGGYFSKEPLYLFDKSPEYSYFNKVNLCFILNDLLYYDVFIINNVTKEKKFLFCISQELSCELQSISLTEKRRIKIINELLSHCFYQFSVFNFNILKVTYK